MRKRPFFGHRDDEVRLQILMNYHSYLIRLQSHSDSMGTRISSEPELVTGEKRFALLALEHQKIISQSEIDWLDELLLERGTPRPSL